MVDWRLTRATLGLGTPRFGASLMHAHAEHAAADADDTETVRFFVPCCPCALMRSLDRILRCKLYSALRHCWRCRRAATPLVRWFVFRSESFAVSCIAPLQEVPTRSDSPRVTAAAVPSPQHGGRDDAADAGTLLQLPPAMTPVATASDLTTRLPPPAPRPPSSALVRNGTVLARLLDTSHAAEASEAEPPAGAAPSRRHVRAASLPPAGRRTSIADWATAAAADAERQARLFAALRRGVAVAPVDLLLPAAASGRFRNDAAGDDVLRGDNPWDRVPLLPPVGGA